jgi:hypothetical protein
MKGLLAIPLFAVAAYWMLTHPIPWYIKGGLIVGAFLLAVQQLGQYSPTAARFILGIVAAAVWGFILGIAALASGNRRR